MTELTPSVVFWRIVAWKWTDYSEIGSPVRLYDLEIGRWWPEASCRGVVKFFVLWLRLCSAEQTLSLYAVHYDFMHAYTHSIILWTWTTEIAAVYWLGSTHPAILTQSHVQGSFHKQVSKRHHFGKCSKYEKSEIGGLWEIYSWVPAVCFITMMSLRWCHLHFDHSQLVQYFTHRYSFQLVEC